MGDMWHDQIGKYQDRYKMLISKFKELSRIKIVFKELYINDFFRIVSYKCYELAQSSSAST